MNGPIEAPVDEALEGGRRPAHANRKRCDVAPPDRATAHATSSEDKAVLCRRTGHDDHEDHMSRIGNDLAHHSACARGAASQPRAAGGVLRIRSRYEVELEPRQPPTDAERAQVGVISLIGGFGGPHPLLLIHTKKS